MIVERADILVDGAPGSGPALLLDAPISFWGGVDPKSGRIADVRHPQHGENIAGTVLFLPGTIGSSSASAVLLELVRGGHAPAATSILSTPLPKLAMSFSRSPACAISAASMRSLMVGTSTSASRTAATSSGCDRARSSMLSRASNSSRMRVSTGSGSLRVMTTSGFFLPDISSSLEGPR